MPAFFALPCHRLAGNSVDVMRGRLGRPGTGGAGTGRARAVRAGERGPWPRRRGGSGVAGDAGGSGGAWATGPQSCGWVIGDRHSGGAREIVRRGTRGRFRHLSGETRGRLGTVLPGGLGGRRRAGARSRRGPPYIKARVTPDTRFGSARRGGAGRPKKIFPRKAVAGEGMRLFQDFSIFQKSAPRA